MIYKYGDIVLETNSMNDVSAMQEHLVKNHGFKLGDVAEECMLDLFNYVLVVNDANYLDVEYRFRSIGKILSLEEVKQIMKVITKVS